MPRYRIYTYDVWGNARNGYEVNRLFRTETVIDLETGVNDELIRKLKKERLIKKRACKPDIEFEGDDEVLYVIYKGKPAFELELELERHPSNDGKG